MRYLFFLLYLLLLINFKFSFATSIYDRCFYQAGLYYNIDYRILKAIAKVESGYNPYAINRNKNGSYDIGIMQINSSWFNTLKVYGMSDPSMLYNPCYNIFVGAWILRQCINRYSNSWKAIDCYNKGGRATDNSLYVWNVYRSLLKVKNETLNIDIASK